MLPSKWSWMVFEAPCWIWPLVIIAFKVNDHDEELLQQQHSSSSSSSSSSLVSLLPLPNAILLSWFVLHYIHRAILYPLQISSSSRMPLGITVCAFCYTLANGYLQSVQLVHCQAFPDQYEWSLQFWIGMTVTVTGFVIGYTSDRTLLGLKKQAPRRGGGGSGGVYRIPHGGLFEYVSCPHFLGEIVEWMGFCIACQGSLASLSFWVWTMANLVPRAMGTHQWYQRKFPEEYPSLQRKAIVPFLL
jgi:hypothetical protein